MTAVRRPHSGGGSPYSATPSALQLPLVLLFAFVAGSLLLYVLVVPDASSGTAAADGVVGGAGPLLLSALPDEYRTVADRAEEGIRSTVARRREQFAKALDSLSSSNLPGRLKLLRDRHQVVGERLAEIKAGTETVQEVLNAAGTDPKQMDALAKANALPPMKLEEIIDYLDNWIHGLHEVLDHVRKANYEAIWEAYHDYTVKTLYVWDREYLSRMPPRRDDGSIFLSLASYRDENCINTIRWAFEKAKNPDKLFVGLVQQNCHRDCMSGVLVGGGTEPVEPDQDVYEAFCGGEGKVYCERGQVRVLNIDEPESLGPYAARYFASKLWFGEQWFMQTDAHMTFKQDWDAISVDMLQKCPSKKPVISHYPPSENADLERMASQAASRLCGPIFATSDLESQIIRLEGSSRYDSEHLDIPRFAPFTAAGYFVAHSDFLREVPFDPFLPWIFMGEEIIMSTRLWTSGYDIFSPSQAVVGHIYVRRHKPKFWESVHRAFSPGVHNPLQAMVLDRVKYQLGYPEAAKDMLSSKSLLTAVEQYTMGTERPLSQYLAIVGLDVTTKEVTSTYWCESGRPPPGFEQFEGLYPK